MQDATGWPLVDQMQQKQSKQANKQASKGAAKATLS